MTPKERMLAALRLEEPDRVPVAPYVGFWYAPKLIDLRVSDYVLGENELRAKILLNAQRRHGYDWVQVSPGHPRDWGRNVKIMDVGDSYRVEEKSTGQMYAVPKDEAPHIKLGEYSLQQMASGKIDEVFQPPDYCDGRLDEARLIVENTGDHVLIAGMLAAPFIQAAQKVGLSSWIKALYRDRALAWRMMDEALKAELRQAEAMAEVGVHAFFIEESWADATVLSPIFYSETAFPFERSLVEALRRLHVPLIFSFPGNPMPVLGQVLQVGADAYHFEESKKSFNVDIPHIREKTRGEACLYAPFDAIRTLREASQLKVGRETEKLVSQVAAGGGAVVATGCPILRDTPPMNLDAMLQTARMMGRYPIRSLA